MGAAVARAGATTGSPIGSSAPTARRRGSATAGRRCDGDGGVVWLYGTLSDITRAQADRGRPRADGARAAHGAEARGGRSAGGGDRARDQHADPVRRRHRALPRASPSSDLQRLLADYREACAAATDGTGATLRAAPRARPRRRPTSRTCRSACPRRSSATLDGVERVATIVRAMKEFAHPQAEKAPADLNRALKTTLTVARNEYKYVADVETEFGDLPPVVCNLERPQPGLPEPDRQRRARDRGRRGDRRRRARSGSAPRSTATRRSSASRDTAAASPRTSARRDLRSVLHDQGGRRAEAARGSRSPARSSSKHGGSLDVRDRARRGHHVHDPAADRRRAAGDGAHEAHPLRRRRAARPRRPARPAAPPARASGRWSSRSAARRRCASSRGTAFDVVVSDMRMPDMDGATLLGIVQERHPETRPDRPLRPDRARGRAARRAGRPPVPGQAVRSRRAARASIERACVSQALLDRRRRPPRRRRRRGAAVAPRALHQARRGARRPGDLDGRHRRRSSSPTSRCARRCSSSSTRRSSASAGRSRARARPSSYLGMAPAARARALRRRRSAPSRPSHPIEGFSVDALETHSTLVARVASGLLPDRQATAEARSPRACCTTSASSCSPPTRPDELAVAARRRARIGNARCTRRARAPA